MRPHLKSGAMARKYDKEVAAYLEDEDQLERDGFGDILQAQQAELRKAGYGEQEAITRACESLVKLGTIEAPTVNPNEIMEWVQNHLTVPCIHPETAPTPWAYAMLIHARKNKEGMNKLIDYFHRRAVKADDSISERMRDWAENTVLLCRRLLEAVEEETIDD